MKRRKKKDDMVKPMSIELKPIKELKEKGDIPVDFEVLIKRAANFKIEPKVDKKKKGKK